ncbi:hypothetical protein SSX86_003756 [Deinandra increscens subsp. villosa]|uniref:Uncharacterized protein n=1 Tax=Deinandra increscens subsp. villosa TaxID=3103831 RepID=A0AAP0H5B5_9ASTR
MVLYGQMLIKKVKKQYQERLQVDAVVFTEELKTLYVTINEGFPLEYIVDMPLHLCLFEMITVKPSDVMIAMHVQLVLLNGNKLEGEVPEDLYSVGVYGRAIEYDLQQLEELKRKGVIDNKEDDESTDALIKRFCLA